MGIWDRLGGVIKSYLNDEDAKIFGRNGGGTGRSGDPDLDAAFEELDDFLSGGGKGEKPGARAAGTDNPESGSGRQGAFRGGTGGFSGEGRNPLTEELKRDFAELGLESGASAEGCKAAYKRLLKVHHPDRHAGHPGNMKKATEKSARINAAYDRIEKWRKGNS